MPLPRRLLSFAWILTLLLALGFLAWGNRQRIRHLERLSAVSGTAPVVDRASPTGYAGGVRVLIAPGHNDESYQWIMQTQQMLATHEWRLRHVAYDNAPTGRAVVSPSLYRWWLAAVAWADHAWSGRPRGLAVEHAAYWADPLLLMLFVTGGTLFAAARFGPLAAALWPLAAATLFPLGGAFLPGAPDIPGLGLVLAVAAVLALLAGILPAGESSRPPRWFAAAGILGGLGVWLNVRTAAPLLLGLGFGALAAAWFSRRSPAIVPPWRAWGVAGAVTTMACWLLEYAPGHLHLRELRLSEIHPLYAIGWLGGAELLARLTAAMRGGRLAARSSDWLRLALAVLALAAVPAVMLAKGQRAFLEENTFAFRLTTLGEDEATGNLAKWIVREGATLRLLAVLAPLLLLVPALPAIARRAAAPAPRFALLLLAGPLLVVFVFACRQPSWWSLLEALLLVVVAVATAREAGAAAPPPRPAWVVPAIVLLLLPGLFALAPGRAAPDSGFSKRELIALAERDFAHWLARRMGPDGANVLAPPDLASSLMYHGGLRALGSAYQENADGFRGSVRLAAAVQADEAQALARQRNLTHIVIPSWEGFLDEYARLGGTDPEHNLIALLHQWLPPRWLRPVPYYLPAGPDFEDERLLVFEMTEVQDHASSLSRLTEYFLDMGQFELAGMAGKALASDYGADLGAEITRARVAIAQRDRAGFDAMLAAIATAIQDGSDDTLAWDRRVTLALVLAEGRRIPLARTQAQRCLEEMGELDLRGLSEATLFRFLSLCKVLNLPVKDEHLHELAKGLLPPPLRAQL